MIWILLQYRATSLHTITMKFIIVLSAIVLVASAAPKAAGGPACSICEMAVQEIDTLLQQHETDIQTMVDKICGYLPQQYRSMCTMMVNMYLPTIIAKIEQGLDPTTICTDFKLCSSFASSSLAKNQLPVLDINWNSIGCDFCTVIFNFVQTQLLGNQIQQQLQADLAKVCNVIPNQVMAGKCITILDQYGSEMFNFATNLLKPSNICPKISGGKCPASL